MVCVFQNSTHAVIKDLWDPVAACRLNFPVACVPAGERIIEFMAVCFLV
jgi:hypothetical protein